MDHPTANLDELVHQKIRLGILASLTEADSVEFRTLQQTLGATSGNLSRHLATLEDAGLVDVQKGYAGKRPRTWISITGPGRRALEREIGALRQLLKMLDGDSVDGG